MLCTTAACHSSEKELTTSADPTLESKWAPEGIPSSALAARHAPAEQLADPLAAAALTPAVGNALVLHPRFFFFQFGGCTVSKIKMFHWHSDTGIVLVSCVP